MIIGFRNLFFWQPLTLQYFHFLKIFYVCTWRILTIEQLLITAMVPYTCPKGDSNLGQSRMAVFENCQATALTTRPPRPVSTNLSYFSPIFDHPSDSWYSVENMVSCKVYVTFFGILKSIKYMLPFSVYLNPKLSLC